MPKETPCKPYFDSVLLFCLLKELKSLEGKRIQAVRRDEENNLYICFAQGMLFYSLNPSLYRVHMIGGKPPKNLERHPFEMNSVPYVIWRYYSLRKVFVFADKTGFGDYRLLPSYQSQEYY